MTLEEIRAASATMLALARHHGMDSCDLGSPLEDYAGYEHLASMVERMNAPDFSIGKANRWLGYIQGAVMMFGNGDIGLEDIKEINRPKNGTEQHLTPLRRPNPPLGALDPDDLPCG